MKRLRAVLLAVGVTLTVFTYLALPILREWYGPAVDLVVYAGLSLVAGGLTYTLVRGTQSEESWSVGQRAFEEEMKRVEEAAEGEETDEEIEEILEEIDK